MLEGPVLGHRQVVAGLAGSIGMAATTLGGCTAEGGVGASPSDVPVARAGMSHRVVTPPTASAVLAAFNVAADRAGLVTLAAGLRDRIAEVHAATGTAACTVTVAVGASLFDGRFGLDASLQRGCG